MENTSPSKTEACGCLVSLFIQVLKRSLYETAQLTKDFWTACQTIFLSPQHSAFEAFPGSVYNLFYRPIPTSITPCASGPSPQSRCLCLALWPGQLFMVSVRLGARQSSWRVIQQLAQPGERRQASPLRHRCWPAMRLSASARSLATLPLEHPLHRACSNEAFIPAGAPLLALGFWSGGHGRGRVYVVGSLLLRR